MIYYRKTLFGRGPKLTAVQVLGFDCQARYEKFHSADVEHHAHQTSRYTDFSFSQSITIEIKYRPCLINGGASMHIISAYEQDRTVLKWNGYD